MERNDEEDMGGENLESRDTAHDDDVYGGKGIMERERKKASENGGAFLAMISQRMKRLLKRHVLVSQRLQN